MIQSHILWVDDEVDSLRSHIVSLESNGYRISPVTNGDDAVDAVRRGGIDLVLLDEMMTGLGGVETLRLLREMAPGLPVVMVTKVEDEELMNRAYEARADDFLIKPVRPSQVLAVVKRFLETERIVGAGIRRDYGQGMAELLRRVDQKPSPAEWADIAGWLFRRQVELDGLGDVGLASSHADARREANRAFFREASRQYPHWLSDPGEVVFSHQIMSRSVEPLLVKGEQVLLVVLDCLRLDQWMVIEPLLRETFAIETRPGMALVPTATPYSRNAIFAGLLPVDIRRAHPEWWEDDPRVGGSLNRHEHALMDAALRRSGLKKSTRYERVDGGPEAQKCADQMSSRGDVDLYALVYGFVDVLVHKRVESQVLSELTSTEAAFRDLTLTWFTHSALLQIFRAAAQAGRTIVVTSDHGSVSVARSTRVVGDRSTSTAVRYKSGRNIRCDKRHAIDIRAPETWGLPQLGFNWNYLVAGEDHFFVYPNHQRQFERRLSDTLQHGGVSLEEMIVPLAVLRPRGR